jgi:hypothetical protein
MKQLYDFLWFFFVLLMNSNLHQMKTNSFTSVIRRWTMILSFVILFFSGWSQQNLGRQTILQFDANNSLLKPDAPPLTESIPMEIGGKNAPFLSGVGGVSFDQLALPLTNTSIKSMQINYNGNAVDGSRLKLVINNKPVRVNLPDWMLVPIAKYADSPYYSCFTLFGKLKDKTLEKQVTAKKGRVMNYHPSFENTLIGMRLGYMDMLIVYPFANDLPKNSNGNYILGKGEIQPNTEANNNGAYFLSQHFAGVQNKYNLTFRSYVISDYTRKITFDIIKDSLVINGTPYYYCWKFNGDRQDYDINKVVRDISSRYKQQIAELSKSPGNQTSRDWIIDKVISVAKRYDGNFGFYTDGTFIDLIKLKTDDEKKQLLSKYAPESMFQMIVNTEAYMNRDSVIYLKEFSDDVSSKPELFEAANPAVWNATINTMRFAAFFRYVKKNFPENWRSFVDQVKQLDPEPRIVTPTIMYDPANKEIKQAVANRKNK